MKKILNFDGLYGDFNAQLDANYLVSELLETRSPIFNWVVNPHIHTQLFQIFFLEEGQVEFKQATQQNQLSNPCIFIISPSALHGFTYSPDAKGRILTIADSMVEALLPTSSAIAVAFNQVQIISLFDDTYTFESLISLIRQIDAELMNDRPEKQAMVQTYLHQLFIILYRLLKLNEAESLPQENVTLKYFRQFQKSIKRGDYTKNIPEFAQELGITSVHLNRVCQAVANKTASQLVQEHQVQEAQKYLIYTSYSVSEIAYLLKFEYPNYFAKLFKKHTGLSPTAFRARQ